MSLDPGDLSLRFVGPEAGVAAGEPMRVGDSDGEVATLTGGGRGGEQELILAR